MIDPVQELSRLTAQLLAIAQQLDPADGAPLAPALDRNAKATADLAHRRLATAKAWLRASAISRKNFCNGDYLFANPAFEILLDLYVEEARGHKISVSSACIAASVPTTTGLRWLVRLEEDSLVERADDPTDKRKTYVALTADARVRIERTLDAAAESGRADMGPPVSIQ